MVISPIALNASFTIRSIETETLESLTMNEKKYFTVSFPTISYFYSTDPKVSGITGKHQCTTSNEPLDDVYHLLSPKPLIQRRPPPRPIKPKPPTEPEADPNPKPKPEQE